MPTSIRARARVRQGVDRILVLADRSAVGRSARRWAARRAGDWNAGILALPDRDELHTTIPAQRDDLLVLGVDSCRGSLPPVVVDLIQTAPCPTMVFRPSTDEPRRVTAAVTGEPSDTAVIGAATRLAGSLGRPLLLVHGRPLPLRRSDTPAEVDQGEQVLDAARDTAQAIAPGLPVSTELIRGHGHEAVSQRGTDEIIVVGAGRGDGLGLVTRAALCHSSAPVVVVNPAGVQLS